MNSIDTLVCIAHGTYAFGILEQMQLKVPDSQVAQGYM